LNNKPTTTGAAASQQDGNGLIENEELKGFIKDLMDFLGKVSCLRLTFVSAIKEFWA